jgi:hypothetical protein
MKVITENQLSVAKGLKVGQVAVVRFETYDQYKSFSVQLSAFNAKNRKENDLYVHAACDQNGYQYCLVAITAEQYSIEKSNSNMKHEWKKKVPRDWKTA